MGDENKENDGSGFGSRFLSGLKDLIIEEEAPRRSSAAPTASQAGSSAATPAMTAPAAPIANANSPMTASLLQLVLNRPTAYTAFTEAMAPLEEIIPDEMTRYRAAFAVIKKNRTLDQVVQAIELQHMQVLEDEVARFSAQAKQKEDADVHARLKEAKTLEANIATANAQVVSIRQEMEARIRAIEESVQRDRARIDDINREAAEKSQAIATVQRQFEGAVAAVRESLSQAKAKILRYLA